MPAYQVAPEGSLIRCATCGHSWLEGHAVEVISTHPARQLATLIDHAPEPELEVRRLVEASREAQENFAAKRARRRRKLVSWVAFSAAAAMPLLVMAGFPELVVRAIPAANGVYSALGLEVNVYGLELRRVELQHLAVDGTVVLAVKGEISNVSGGDRKIPWLRFGLHDSTGKEVYEWTLDSGARPLRSGESTNFVTRVATPPDSAKNLEIRFARADEIRSNASP
jgi:hypothetical protein